MNAPDLEFLTLINSLPNMEKSRNFYTLHDYSLRPFEEFLKKFKFHSKPRTKFSIVGTNGKGSLCHYLNQILMKYGSVGLYTSPHFIHPLERIQINAKRIEELKLNAILNSLNNELKSRLREFSYFEIFTLFCILAFQDEGLDFEIYEAGLGGKLDATKLAESEIVILTKIDLDHMQILGSTKEKILLEKLGICGKSTKKIYALNPEDANLNRLLNEFSDLNSIPLEVFTTNKSSSNYLQISYEFAEFILLKEGKRLGLPVIENSWTDFPRPQGRLEVIQESPLLIYDTAHNPGACWNLLKDLGNLYPETNWTCMLSLLPDKDIEGILEIFENAKNVKSTYISHFPPFISEFKSNSFTIYREKDWIQEITNNHKERIPTVVCGSFRVYQLLQEISHFI